jgi:hypothetical protein
MSIEIRSFRSVFDLERRIYRVDRVRLNPAGVPLRGAVYFALLVLAALSLAALPLLGPLARVLPWYLRDLALPAGGAALLTVVRVDARPFHTAAWALARYILGPSRIRGGDPSASMPPVRWRPREIVVLADGSEPRLRRVLCVGPAEVRVAVAHERVQWRNGPLRRLLRREGIAVRELSGRRPARCVQGIELRAGTRLRVR